MSGRTHSPGGGARSASPAVTFGLGLFLFSVLVANGRAIVAGDTRPTEHLSASLVQEGAKQLGARLATNPRVFYI